MAFSKQAAIVPSKISGIEVRLSSTRNSDGGIDYLANVWFRVVDANGTEIITRSIELEQHLTAAQKTQLRTFVDGLRAKIENEVL